MSVNLRLDLLQLTLQEEIVDVLPAGSPVQWTAQTPKPPTDNKLPYMTLNVLGGPSDIHRQRAQARSIALPNNATITVDLATVGDRYFAQVNRVAYWADGVTGDTVTTIRDKLANAMQSSDDGTEPYVAATDSGADAVVLTPNEPGDLWDLKHSSNLSTVLGSLSSYSYTETPKRLTVTLQMFSRETSPRLGAVAQLNEIVARLQRPATAQRLDDRGLAILNRGPVIPVTALVGDSSWESRAALDVEFKLNSVSMDPVETIGQVDLSIQAAFVPGGSVTTRTLSVS